MLDQAAEVERNRNWAIAAKCLSAIMILVGITILILACGVLTGRITEGWGFPSSPVPNLGRWWGVPLLAAAILYIACPIYLFVQPDRGCTVVMIMGGINVLLGTPIIQSSTEILYNCFQEVKSRPDWTDAVWVVFMMINIGIIVVTYRPDNSNASEATASPVP